MENINSKEIIESINKYEKKCWAMKSYAAYRWGEDLPCPYRFVINIYKSCSFRCRYCYVWNNKEPSIKENLLEALEKDIKRANNLNLKLPVFISSSTDPFQNLEEKYKNTKQVIEKLLENNFPIVIMTKNPKMLLKKSYIKLTKNNLLHIDVTIASITEDNPSSIFWNNGLSIKEKLNAIEKLIKLGKDVRVKIDPIIPSVNGIKGQTKEDLWGLVKLLKEIGVKKIISKTLKINKDVPPFLYTKLIDYYKENGEYKGINYCLSKEIRRKLLQPLYEACINYGIEFCPCVELDVFSKEDKISNCLIDYENK
ncbi:MAG: radical SAM protein [archaeon]